MKNVKSGILLLIIVFLHSCSVKKDLSAKEGELENITIVNFKGSDMYALRLAQLSEISGDTLIIENPVSAVEYILDSDIKTLAIGLGEGKRNFNSRNTLDVLEKGRFPNQEGTVLVFDFCIDREGTFVSASYSDETTAVFNEQYKDDVLKAIMGYHVDADENADPIECGSTAMRIESINRVVD